MPFLCVEMACLPGVPASISYTRGNNADIFARLVTDSRAPKMRVLQNPELLAQYHPHSIQKDSFIEIAKIASQR